MDGARAVSFSRILIANRGEIASRIIRTCRRLRIESVAVYSDADAEAPYVREADLAARIGPAPAEQSYLNVEAVLEAARLTGAQAIHPGYGFLSENSRFTRACREAGIVFIGPPPEAMDLLGSKRAAKHLARRVGIPVVPGYDGEEQSDDRLSQEAEAIGFPLLIKASAGGGGKGMRVVRSAHELSEALSAARREAVRAFGDGNLLLERLVESPRHVEIQVLADAHGNVLHLGERDCSVQRRHQKVIEESPSPALSEAQRRRIGEDAARLVAAAGYTNAGTVEFILASDGGYYFLEVNTRLQVEHPVTEMVTGLDLVAEQIRIAAGEPLSLSQADVRLSGHAVECRVYAEDPYHGFLPSTGELVLFRTPEGSGIRNDIGVAQGSTVTPYYDPMLGKLITWAADRASALDLMSNALRRYVVAGVEVNVPLLRAVVDSDDFRSGSVTTDYLDEHLTSLLPVHPLPARAAFAAAAWLLAEPVGRRASAWSTLALRTTAQPRQLTFQWGAATTAVAAWPRGESGWLLTSGEDSFEGRIARKGSEVGFVGQGEEFKAAVTARGPSVFVVLEGASYSLRAWPGLGPQDAASSSSKTASGGLQAPMPGTVVKLHVAEGQRVAAGDPLLVLEAMKMEHTVTAPYAGVVRRLPFQSGEAVAAGEPLAEIEP